MQKNKSCLGRQVNDKVWKEVALEELHSCVILPKCFLQSPVRTQVTHQKSSDNWFIVLFYLEYILLIFTFIPVIWVSRTCLQAFNIHKTLFFVILSVGQSFISPVYEIFHYRTCLFNPASQKTPVCSDWGKKHSVHFCTTSCWVEMGAVWKERQITCGF